MVFRIANSEKIFLTGIYPKTVSFQNSTQKVNKDGVPLWSFRVFSVKGGNAFSVTVPSEKKPTFEEGEKIKFINLAINVAKKDNLNLVWFTAENVDKDV